MRIPEGDPHKAIVEAISRRIRQLYPPSRVRIRENKQVGRLSFRPDIYVEHTDGRKWAYEVVHSNSRKLRKKPDAYVQAGISGIWILWQELGPKTHRASQPDQGILIHGGDNPLRCRLNRPERELLSLQTGDERFLYVFAIDPAYRGVELSEFMKTLTIGFEIYTFMGWSEQRVYPADFEFISLAQADFDEQGRPYGTERPDTLFDGLCKHIGLNLSSHFIPSEVMARVDRLATTPDELKKIAPLFLVYQMMTLPAAEQQEILAYFQSEKPKQLQSFQTAYTGREVAHAFQDGNTMQELAPETQRLKTYVEQTDAPDSLKRILLALVDPKQVEDMAELMKWQSGSKALRGARERVNR